MSRRPGASVRVSRSRSGGRRPVRRCCLPGTGACHATPGASATTAGAGGCITTAARRCCACWVTAGSGPICRPGCRVPLQQWHAKVTVSGLLGIYTLRLRLPGLDDAPDPAEQAPVAAGTGEGAVTSTRYRAPLTGSDRLVLAARFEAYLTWRHAGVPAPASARDTAERIGWQAHTVAKRCENIRARYARLGVPGLG